MKIKINAKNVVTRDIPDIDDSVTLPSLHINAGKGEEDNTTMYNILKAPPPMSQPLVNDKSTSSSNITMDTRIYAEESNMFATNQNIGNHDNSINHTSHTLAKIMYKTKQGNNLLPAESANKQQDKTVLKLSRIQISTTCRNESVHPG